MNWKELHEIQECAARMTPHEQLHRIERPAAILRKRHLSDHAGSDHELAAIVADPAIQHVLDLWQADEIDDDDLRAEVERGIDAANRGEVVDRPTFMRELLALSRKLPDPK